MRSKRLILATALFAATAASAAAQSFSPEMTKAIQAVALDTAKAKAIMSAQSQLTELLVKDKERMKRLSASLQMAAEQQIAQMEKDPAESAILKAGRLSARDYFTGLMALRAAAWAATGQKGPLATLASPANVNFLKATPAILDEFNRIESGDITR